MAQSSLLTIVSDSSGVGQNANLNAIIDETIAEHIMTRRHFEGLYKRLEWRSSTQPTDKELQDSYGVSYTAKSKVSLFIRPRTGGRSETFVFYLVESATLTPDILIAKKGAALFPASGQDAKKVYPVAPSELIKGRNGKERTEWKKNASEYDKENAMVSESNEAIWEQKMKEQQEKSKGKAPQV
ncbi:hypothetical protein BJX70DRAFT_367935 [Aspergillus crustosus]